MTDQESPVIQASCVYIVEDDTPTRELLETLFEIEGYAFVAFENFALALENLARYLPRIAIIDFRVPGRMSAETFIREARLRLPDLKIILWTATPPVLTEWESIGVNEVLTKPSDRKSLLTLVHNLCPRLIHNEALPEPWNVEQN